MPVLLSQRKEKLGDFRNFMLFRQVDVSYHTFDMRHLSLSLSHYRSITPLMPLCCRSLFQFDEVYALGTIVRRLSQRTLSTVFILIPATPSLSKCVATMSVCVNIPLGAWTVRCV